SVAAQLRALRDHAEKNNYVVVREYIDEAESGRVASRPQFRRMLDEASADDAPFEEILVWKFSRFTRKREHAVAFKSMLRRRGIRVTSITEDADDSPTGKLMEAIIESVDDFYSENLAQEVMRGLRESASRGFWVAPRAPYGYRKVKVQDGPRERPKLELNPPADGLVRRIFELALQGRSVLEISKTLNAEGIPSPAGKRWNKTTIHQMLTNETYTGTLLWGVTAKDGLPPVRVEDAFPAIVSKDDFRQVASLLRAKAPAQVHPRRAASPYLLSGLVRCRTCRRALTAAEAKSGKYSYYVCQSLLKRGSGSCKTPRLNAPHFERLIVEQIREHILTESNIRDLVRLVDEEMDGVAREERAKLESIEAELAGVRAKMDRLWHAVETSDLEINDILPRLRLHQESQERLEAAAEDARRSLSERRAVLDNVETITAFAREMSEFLRTSELTESKAFIRSFVKEIVVVPGTATIRYTIPTPQDSPIGGRDAAEVELPEAVRSTVSYGWGPRTRTRGQ
ncbi:MAG: recombinase family protein, partial [Gammaproteobacteria bacterium]|nr:recombinase family protein [Gammaproteobacteria bacterium]